MLEFLLAAWLIRVKLTSFEEALGHLWCLLQGFGAIWAQLCQPVPPKELFGVLVWAEFLYGRKHRFQGQEGPGSVGWNLGSFWQPVAACGGL